MWCGNESYLCRLRLRLYRYQRRIPRNRCIGVEEANNTGESVKAEEVPLHGTDIRDERGKRVGKWLGGVENLGLALCRLEPMVLGKGKEGRGFWIGEGDVARRCRAFVPGWMDLREGKGGKGEE